MELKGSKTEQNLMAAFAGESQASIKYQYYASQAKKDGYVKIRISLKKLQKMKKNMRSYGLKRCMVEKFLQLQ